MKISNSHRILHSRKWTFIRRLTVEESAFHTTAEQQDTSRAGKVPVHSIKLEFTDHIRLIDLVRNWSLGLAFDEHTAAKLTGEHNQRAVEKPALFEVQNKLGDRPIETATVIALLGVGYSGADFIEAFMARYGKPGKEPVPAPMPAGMPVAASSTAATEADAKAVG